MSNLRPPTSPAVNPGSSHRFRQQRQVGLLLLGTGALYTALYSSDRLPTRWTCPLLALTGLPCPTCGLTRSLAATWRGDWVKAVQFHVFGPPLFTIGLAIGLVWLAELWRQRSLLPWRSLVRHSWLPLLVGLLLYYSTRLWWSWQAGLWPPPWAIAPL
ncbi:DUF2752 domain-containing protein [Synechococcus elongatus]|uniref:DUF2752 domain-containing protein n=1 Tax=Synechococcus elongatus TaxID=32046 RepID=UPI001E4B04E9|nr:DUF2752 domain-containing protein [Synechococcus elongatus]WKW05965.1 DUF2752 domain-containing protein [Synechococcus elongatus PCC 7942 = FACHB-805]